MIKFGTDGWRGKIADDFTFENVRRVAQAIINFIKRSGQKEKRLVVGYDNRFLSKEYAEEVAGVAASNDVPVFLSDRSLPSPVLSFAVKTMKAAGGVMITASHNPPEYNGIKFKAHYAGSALKTITNKIEEELKLIKKPDIPEKLPETEIKRSDFKKAYINDLKRLIDFELIKKSNAKVVVDPMHGSGIGYFKEILEPLGLEVIEVNSNPDPLFGGISPEPLPKNLEELISQTKELGLKYPDDLVIGIALDGDGDRISAVDPTGVFINPHNIFSILLKHLIENKKWKGEVVRTFNVTKLIDKLCEKYGLKLHETPIGFKYICELMLKRDILVGGEESGGIGVKNHIPERDAIVVGLMLLEAQAIARKNIGQMLKDLFREFGEYSYDRNDIRLDQDKASEFLSKLKEAPPKKFCNKEIKEVLDLDGVKLVFDDESWILFRASGTEPLLRIYAEGRNTDDVEAMIGEGEKLVTGTA